MIWKGCTSQPNEKVVHSLAGVVSPWPPLPEKAASFWEFTEHEARMRIRAISKTEHPGTRPEQHTPDLLL